MNLDPTVLLQFIKPKLEKLAHVTEPTALTADDLELINIVAQNYLDALENPLPVAPVPVPPTGAPSTAVPAQVVPVPSAAGGAQAPGVPQVKHTRTMNERNAAAIERARRKAEQSGAPPPPAFSGQDGGFVDEDIPEPAPVRPMIPGMAPPTEPSPQIRFAEDGTPLVDTSHLLVPPPGTPGNPIPDQQG